MYIRQKTFYTPCDHTNPLLKQDGSPMKSTSKRGKTMSIHRYLYEQKHGPLKPGMKVYRACGNLNCFNVGHFDVAGTG